uniref:SWIM-type domain-containing protein n=1 Tax=Metapenaeus joyneri majanivirus TaxID=2984280 RepID=A0A9C7BWB0_9VIRU|nr:MAG: hypothetical protein [Metapenaeus joyneri majanivirus]
MNSDIDKDSSTTTTTTTTNNNNNINNIINNKNNNDNGNDNNNNGNNKNNENNKNQTNPDATFIEKKFFDMILSLLQKNGAKLGISKAVYEPDIFYSNFCNNCVNVFSEVVASKLQQVDNKRDVDISINNTHIRNEVENYLYENYLGVIERIEEENVDNLILDNLQQSPFSTMPLQMCRDLAMIMANNDILKLSNLSGHILRKSLLRGAIFELKKSNESENSKKNNKYITNVSHTFDDALTKSIPDDIYCTCNNYYNKNFSNLLCKHFYAKDWESDSDITVNSNNGIVADNNDFGENDDDDNNSGIENNLKCNKDDDNNGIVIDNDFGENDDNNNNNSGIENSKDNENSNEEEHKSIVVDNDNIFENKKDEKKIVKEKIISIDSNNIKEKENELGNKKDLISTNNTINNKDDNQLKENLNDIPYKYNIDDDDDDNVTNKKRNVNDKYICLQICKHEKKCTLGINNKMIINRNITVTTSNKKDTNGIAVGKIYIQNTNKEEPSNMIFILGSTLFRKEKKSCNLYENNNNNSDYEYDDENKEKLNLRNNVINFEKHNELLMLLNKNNKVKKSNVDTYLKFANRYLVEKSATVAITTCIAPITTKMFNDSSILENKMGYNRKTNTFYLGPVDRNDTYTLSRKWLEDYVTSNINVNMININNDDTNNNNNNNTENNNISMIINPPLCGGKNYYSKIKDFNNIKVDNINNNSAGKISLLNNIETLNKLFEIFESSMEDCKNIYREIYTNIALNQPDMMNDNTSQKYIEETIGKKYLMCFYSKLMIGPTLSQLNEIGKLTYNIV